MIHTDDTTLQRWIAARDAAAFREIVVRHSAMVYATCRRVTGDATQAQDVAQECFLALAQVKRPPAANLGPWLHRVATNLALKQTRGERRRYAREQAFAAAQPVHRESAWDEVVTQVDAAIAELPESLRVPIVRHFLENQTQTEIARALGCSQQTISWRIQKGIDHIGKVLRRRGALVGMSALPALLQANLSVAAPLPPSMIAALGKLALAQAAPAAGGMSLASNAAAAVLGGILVKKVALAVSGLLVMLIAGWAILGEGSPPRAPASDATKAEASIVAAPSTVLQPTKEASASPASPAPDAPLLTASPAETQAGSAAPRWPEVISNPQDYATVQGWVVDQENAPVPGAAVLVRAYGVPSGPSSAEDAQEKQAAWQLAQSSPEHAFSAISDDTGFFSISGIKFAGMARAEAQAEGHVPVTETAVLQPGAPSELTLRLKAGVPIHGELLDPQQQPVQNAAVKITALRFNQGGRGSVGESGLGSLATTDAQGLFTVWLEPWGEDVAQAAFQAESQVWGQKVFSGIEVRPESHVELQYAGFAALFGMTRWEDGTAAAGCTIEVRGSAPGTSLGPPTSLTTTVDAGGAYLLERLDTELEYSAQLRSPKREPLLQDIEIGLLKTGERRELNITIPTPATLSGIVRGMPSGDPLPGVWVHLEKAGGRPTLTAIADEAGRYRFTVPSGAGEYTLYAERIDQEPEGETTVVTIEDGVALEADLEIPDPWSRSFVIKTAQGQPLANARAILRESFRGMEGEPHYPDASDAQGRLRVGNLAPDAEVSVRFEHSDFVITEAPPHTGQSGEALPVEHITAYRPAGLVATLVDPAGVPVAEARVNVTLHLEDSTLSLRARTNSEGVLALPQGVPATAFALELRVTRESEAESISLEALTPQVAPPSDSTTDLGTIVLSTAE